ncbi:heme ABC transporter ATP-binding protein [uncultured Roseovarius sp.]|uniref:heme ABC transporter ATP-binding protein n=1 Tax=uncultured Roseovarius sp. TaxID=293344 RepID=UPI00262462FB|nr:heme ABC transporter ATP-binding protein [uncultured Roseovarius sp.]
MLRADHVSLRLGGTAILHNVSLSARAGQLTAIAGPNGSGKTTLLRALTGEFAAEGTITMDGLQVHPRHAMALAERRGVLPQAARLAFPFTVIEVVRIGHGAGRHAHRPDLPLHALGHVGLRHMAGRFYQDLSGGEQQRVQLARVLAQIWEPTGPDGPNWLFLDEPVSSLDIGHQLAVMRLVRDFAARGGGVVAVMHDLNLTAMFADRVVMMQSGHVAAKGPPATVITSETLSAIYDCDLKVSTLPRDGMPYLLPQAAGGDGSVRLFDSDIAISDFLVRNNMDC